uniref:Uncharacterized protein n=1 Tax=Cucumis melo TaxID=3656 RepID=A0A9I9EDN6_CUCME
MDTACMVLSMACCRDCMGECCEICSFCHNYPNLYWQLAWKVRASEHKVVL